MTIITIDAMRAHAMIREGALLIDIRDRDEHARERIPLAKNIPLSKLCDGDVNATGQPLIYHCKSGNRTRMNAPLLAQAAPPLVPAARSDGLAHVAHQYARQTNLGNGTSRAENAILWWSLRDYGSVQQVVKLGLADMWQQGDDGAHYRNMVGNYTETGCGIYLNGDEVTVVQAFR